MLLLRRRHQLAWAVILGCLALGLVPTLWSIFRGDLVNVETPPRFHASYQVNINQGDWPEFAVLPGIGEVTAKRIVQYRKERGPFRRVEDLIKVPGVGPKTLEQIRPFLNVEPVRPDQEELPSSQGVPLSPSNPPTSD
ncbi:MAG: helix-hairpin-helix domain-containing protein [Thermoguttaceae bacterium]|nr:helix-hairpin-helix domain-containing protein [Thermoguttaceae bacterium]MDW8077948.1 helix-hairpin-helix domain-containing protein [Thermoguttaceae bacterium]